MPGHRGRRRAARAGRRSRGRSGRRFRASRRGPAIPASASAAAPAGRPARATPAPDDPPGPARARTPSQDRATLGRHRGRLAPPVAGQSRTRLAQRAAPATRHLDRRVRRLAQLPNEIIRPRFEADEADAFLVEPLLEGRRHHAAVPRSPVDRDHAAARQQTCPALRRLVQDLIGDRVIDLARRGRSGPWTKKTAPAPAVPPAPAPPGRCAVQRLW